MYNFTIYLFKARNEYFFIIRSSLLLFSPYCDSTQLDFPRERLFVGGFPYRAAISLLRAYFRATGTLLFAFFLACSAPVACENVTQNFIPMSNWVCITQIIMFALHDANIENESRGGADGSPRLVKSRKEFKRGRGISLCYAAEHAKNVKFFVTIYFEGEFKFWRINVLPR